MTAHPEPGFGARYSDATPGPGGVNGAPNTDTLACYSWALFEFARTPYFGLVFIFAFAPYFAEVVVGDAVRGQEIWSLTNTIVGICVGLLAPLMGALSDCAGRRKPWLAAVVAVMVPACFALWFAMPEAQGGLPVLAIAALIIILNVSFEFGQVFHNSLLPLLAGGRNIGWLSGLGIALGNVGNLLATVFLLFFIALPASGDVLLSFLPDPSWLGLDVARHEQDRIVGPLSGLWLLLASLPFFLWTPDHAPTGMRLRQAVRSGLQQLWTTVKRAREFSNVGLFLVTRMLYNDGMVAIQAYSGIIAVGMFKWNLTALLLFSICLSPCTIFGAQLGGWLDRRFGSRRVIQLSVIGTAVFLIGALSMTPNQILFLPYDTAAAVPLWSIPFFQTLPEVLFIIMYQGLALMVTTTFVSSRAMMARISPPEMSSQFFGLYAVSGWATAFLGHGLVAFFTATFADQRIGLGAVVLLLVPGAALMSWVREARQEAAPVPSPMPGWPA
jgi:UMF1 family MFS transporter